MSRSSAPIVALDLDLEQEFGDVSDLLNEGALKRAQVRAVNKTLRWLKTQFARELARSAKIPQKHLKNRFRLAKANRNQSEIMGSFWLGLFSLDPTKLGLKGRKLKKGYKIGKFLFEKGFMAFYKEGKGYSDKQRGVYKRVGRKRYPIKKQKIDLDQASIDIYDRLIVLVESRLNRVMRQEVNYEILKARGEV